MHKALRKTTTPGYRPECTASQTESAAAYDSWCYTHTHTHTLRRVRWRKEHSLIIAAVQRRSGNVLLLLWFYWRQAWNIVTQRPTGRQITHIISATMPKITPIRGRLYLSSSSLRMKLQRPTQMMEAQNELRPQVDSDVPTFQRLFQSSHARRARIILLRLQRAEMQASSDTYASGLAQQRTLIPTAHTSP